MKNFMKKTNLKTLIVLTGILIFMLSFISGNVKAAEKKYVTRGDVIKAVNEILGAKTQADTVTVNDLEKNSDYYKDMSTAIRAGLISPNKNNKLLPERNATNWYIANMLSRATGLPAKEILGSKKTNGFMTEKQLSAFIKKIVPNIVSSNTSKIKTGTVVINKPDITLKDLNINGNLVIGDGAANGTITLENVVVKGKTYIRGGGANSVYVKGNSKLLDVKVKQVYNKVRLHISETASINDITMKEGCNDIICEGKLGDLIINSSDHSVTLNNASIQNLTISKKNVSVETNGETKIDSAFVKPSASNVKMNLNQNTTIKNLDIQGEKLEVAGKGHIGLINNAANNTSINAPYSQIKMEEGVTGTLINGKPADKKDTESPNNSNSNNNSSNNNSSSNSGNNDPDPSYSDIEIIGVYSKPGSVQVVLNKAVSLKQSAFYISCPTGKDMTILKAETAEGTEKNKVYNLSTAFYADNTYILTVTLPNGRKVEKEFITSSEIPVISNIYTERTGTTTGEFSFTADDFGIVYYTLIPNKTNSKTNLGTSLYRVIGSEVPKNGEEIKNKGEKNNIQPGLNTISFNNIKEGTSYTIYYAIAVEEKDTPILQAPVQINAKPEITTPSEISVEECIGIDSQTISVKFNKPTKIPLELNAFTVNCPAGNIALDHLETSDMQTYILHLPKTDFMMSYNTYTVTIHFPDSTTTKGSFYGDFQWPMITGLTIRHTEPSKIIVTLKSDEAGKLHYVISETELTKIDEVMQNPNVKTIDLFAGANEIEITDITEGIDQYFCIVPEDLKGNIPAFVSRKKVPTEITPDVTPDLNDIIDITTGTNSMGFTTLTVSLKEEEDLYSLNNKYDVTIYTLEGENKYEPRIITLNNIDDGSTLKGKNFMFGLNITLPTGRYKLEINLPVGGTVSKEFTIQ